MGVDNHQDQQGLEKEFAPGISRRQTYLIFGIGALSLIMAGIDQTIVAVGLPTFITDLQTNLALVGWTITGFQFAQSIIMPISGKLSDEWGRKRLFLAAVFIFTASSVAAGLAPNIYWLIFFRVIQGIGGGAFLPSMTGIVSDSFGKNRAPAIGLFGSVFAIGGILGPNIGGVILDHFSWRWIFFINLPLGIILLVLGLKMLPETRVVRKGSNRQMDVIGISLFSGAILAILFALTNWANAPESVGIATWLLFVIGAVFFVLFMRYEDRNAQPMIDTKLLRWRPFLAVNIYNFIFGAVVFGLVSFIPYYATVAYGMTAGESGLLLTPRSVTMIVVSALTSFFIIRFRYRIPMIIGLVLMSASLFGLSRGYHDVAILGLDFNNLALLSIIIAIAGVGMGISNPAANNAALDLIPEKVAAVAGMRGMARIVGGVIGTSVVTLVLSYFPDKAEGMQDTYVGFGFLLLLLVPIVFLIPDFAYQRRKGLDSTHRTKPEGSFEL